MQNSNTLQLFEEANLLNDNEAKLELLEQIIALAKDQEQVQLVHAARASYIDTASFCAKPQKTLAMFEAYLDEFDALSDEQDDYDLLWRYKWALHQLRETPSVKLDGIDEKLADFEARLLKARYSLRPLFYQKLAFALQANKLDKAKEFYQAWQLASRDPLADCLACERHLKVQYFLALNDLDSASNMATALLNYELSCHAVPQITYAILIRAHLEHQDLNTAKQHHKLNYSHIRTSTKLLELGYHLLLLSLSGDLNEASKLLEDKLSTVITSEAQESKFYFLLGLDAFCKKMRSEQKTLGIELSPFETLSDLEDLAQWCKQSLQQLVLGFDARNQTAAFKTRYEANSAIIEQFLES